MIPTTINLNRSVRFIGNTYEEDCMALDHLIETGELPSDYKPWHRVELRDFVD